ncbi:T9SS type A sorting domain-containing protein [candidate division KSB1 bacterium]|nr:T9SS type A sorting domain-containing protein [candidate division KSB1 bacterium]
MQRETYAPSPTIFDTFYRKDSLDQVFWLFDIDRDEQIVYKLNVPVGTSWDNPYMNFRRTLEDTSAIQHTPAGTFDHCYHYSLVDLPYYRIDTHQWLAPDIGLIHREDEGEAAILNGAYVNGILYGDTTTTSVNVENSVSPDDLLLFHNFPNPFNQSTSIYYNVPESADGHNVRLELYNTLGQRVRVLLNKSMSSGEYWTLWNGKDERGVPVASGVYILNLIAKDVAITRKITLTR